MTLRQLPPGEQTFDPWHARANDLCQRIANAEAFTITAGDPFEEVGSDPHRRRRFARLLTEAAIATQAALAVDKKLAEDLARHRVET